MVTVSKLRRWSTSYLGVPLNLLVIQIMFMFFKYLICAVHELGDVGNRDFLKELKSIVVLTFTKNIQGRL